MRADGRSLPSLCCTHAQDADVINTDPALDANRTENAAPQEERPPTTTAASTGAAGSSPPNPNSFEEQYTLGKMIGSGTFSVVRDAIHKPTGQKYAIKCIKREGLTAEDIEALTTEVAILKQVGSQLVADWLSCRCYSRSLCPCCHR